MDLFAEVFDLIKKRLEGRKNDLERLRCPLGSENNESGVTWHSFEKWLVLESFFACCEHFKGGEYNVIPEPLYRWQVRPEDERAAKEKLMNRRADLLVKSRQNANISNSAICLEFTLVHPGDNPTTTQKLTDERDAKIYPAMEYPKSPNEWAYYQIVVIHRVRALAERKRAKTSKSWAERVKHEDLIRSVSIDLDGDQTDIHAFYVEPREWQIRKLF